MPLVSITCPGCAAAIQVPSDRSVAYCSYCGRQIQLERNEEAVREEAEMKLARVAAEGGNHTEAYLHYTQALELEPSNAVAWVGKGVSALWLSSLDDLRTDEFMSCVKQGLGEAGDDPELAVHLAKEAATAAHDLCYGIIELAQRRYFENQHTSVPYASGILEYLAVAADERIHDNAQRRQLALYMMQAVYLAKLSWDLCPSADSAKDFRALTKLVVNGCVLAPAESQACAALSKECEAWQWSPANWQQSALSR